MRHAKEINLSEKLPGRAKNRIWELDFLRGICIILMIFDHAMYNFGWLVRDADNFISLENFNPATVPDGAMVNQFFMQMQDIAVRYWSSTLRIVVRSVVLFLFLFLSGLSCAFTRSNAGRLRKMSTGAALVTVATYSVDAIAGFDVSIAFGILHILTFSLLLYMIMKLFLPHRGFYLAVGALLVIGGMFLQTEKYGTVPFWQWEKLDPIYGALDWEGFTRVFMGTASFGGDSYGIFPYTGFFLLGAGAAEALYPKKRSLLPKLDGAWNRAYTFVGRHGIAIYLVHQVVVVLIVMLAAMAVGYKFF